MSLQDDILLIRRAEESEMEARRWRAENDRLRALLRTSRARHIRLRSTLATLIDELLATDTEPTE